MPDLRDSPPPLGALAVIAVGIFATVLAAMLSTDKPIGAAELSWIEKRPLPDSKPAPIPGGGEMRLTDAGIRASEPNASDYKLYRVAAVLRIAPGSATGQGQARCAIRVPTRTIVAHSTKHRASYPRPSEEDSLIKQDVPERRLIEFNSRGTDLAFVELEDAFETYTDHRGVTVSWAEFKVGRQEWIWGLPTGRPERQLHLGFVSIWRTTASPAARIVCRLRTGAGTTAVRTAGSL